MKKKFLLTRFTRSSYDLIDKQYISNYYEWFSKKETTENTYHMLWEKNESFFENYFNAIYNKEIISFAILIKEAKSVTHIGNVSLHIHDKISKSAELSIIIGEPKYLNCGAGSFACKSILDIGFNKYNLYRIWLGTAETNIGMIKIAEKIGFIKEGTLRSEMFLNGKYVDVLRYGIMNYEYDIQRGNNE